MVEGVVPIVQMQMLLLEKISGGWDNISLM